MMMLEVFGFGYYVVVCSMCHCDPVDSLSCPAQMCSLEPFVPIYLYVCSDLLIMSLVACRL